jgi:hypothetical protein
MASIPNIGPRGVRLRRRAGMIALALAIGMAAVLFGLGASRPWRVALFAPLWVAALGFFQAREKT